MQPQDWLAHAELRGGLEDRAGSIARQRATRDAWQQQEAVLAEEKAKHRRAQTRAASLQRSLENELEKRARLAAARNSAVLRLACAASPELRALERRCLTAQASQQQALQLLRQELQGEEARQAEGLTLGGVEAAWLRSNEAALLSEQAGRADSEALCRELRAQATWARAERQRRLEQERLQDRAMADDAAARARAEDKGALARRRQMQDEVREALDRLLETRDLQRAADALREEREEHQVAAWCGEQRDLAARLATERLAAEEARSRVLERLSQQLHGLAAMGKGLEELRGLLQAEELEVEKRREEEEAMRRTIQARAASAKACEEGLQRLEERRRAAQEEEAGWHQEFLERLAEEDRVEHLSAQRRRMQLLAHRREATRLVDGRRQREEAERRQQAEELLRRRQEDDSLVRAIEEERRSLLQVHKLMMLQAF